MKLITGQLRPSKGDGERARRADLEQPGALLPHRLLSRAGLVLRPDDRARVGDGARPAERARRAEAAKAAERALTTVDLMEAANKRIGAYSKGMRQRVKLAQALVHDPSC